jgi:hypothetical protein
MAITKLVDNESPFAKFEAEAWPYRWNGTIRVRNIAGGTPSDINVAEAWYRTKIADKEDLMRDLIAKLMVDRGISAEEAAKYAAELKHLSGFKRDAHGLYIEGRQLKSAIKEAANVAVAANKLSARGWGATNKGLQGFIAEHVCVVEERLYLGVKEPTGINQRFVATFRGTGIQYEEYVDEADIDFTILTDFDFKPRDWAMIWLTGEQQGIGASRSQGFGRYREVRWDRA